MVSSDRLVRAVTVATLLTVLPALLASQASATPVQRPESVEVVAGIQYQAGGLHRWLLGNTYRDLWTTPIHVQVLNLETFAGGLHPDKVGGGNQTKSLHMTAAHGVDYVFRPLYKADKLPRGMQGTVVETIVRDQNSTNDPGAPLVAARLLDAAGVLHVTPSLVIMPDDSLLGAFRKEFAGQLGMMEESPGSSKHHPGFAGAEAIIDSDSLLTLLNASPGAQIDAPALLAARLMDMLFNDWDRHPGQWKWAQMRSDPPSAWLPVPRDRDKTFISSDGVLIGLMGYGRATIYPFNGTYPSVHALTWNSLEFDRRLLDGLGRPVWDSVAADLVHRISDSVIDDAVLAVPSEYLPSAPQVAAILKQRRDGLPGAADRFYLYLALAVDIHATDAGDRAVVTRVSDRFVDVQLASAAGTIYYARRFDAEETREIRVYLHGGDDSALVTGQVREGIPVRILGGNGTNVLLDSSLVAGSGKRTHLYDEGTVRGIEYGPDTLFDRRPWIDDFGKYMPPGPDHGGRTQPVAGLDIGDLGLMVGAGLNKVTFGFERYPYASQVGFEAEYAAGVNGFRVGIATDHRRENAALHFTTSARMSQLQITNYHGLGNATPGDSGDYYAVREQQWRFQPAVVLDVGRWSALSLGPVVQYTVSDSAADRFVTTTQPYGYGQFGQAGLRMNLSHDLRDPVRFPHRGFMAGLGASVFPAMWDVKNPFGDITANAVGFVTLPVPVRPILALRGSARKVFGLFPFQESAFIGGDNSVRTLEPQRYAGDASLAGSAELRVPVANFAFVLPLSVGIFGFLDAGRVWAEGSSPTGWHTAAGGGFWVGLLDPATSISVTFTNAPGASAVLIRGGLAF